MPQILKSDKVRWLKYAIMIPKPFYKLKSDIRFMICGIHVFTYTPGIRFGGSCGQFQLL